MIINDITQIKEHTPEVVDLMDYKIFCFNGEPKYIQVDWGRFSETPHRNMYDSDWNFIPFTNNIKHPFDKNTIIPRPQNFDKMLELACKLSAGFPHLRVDLYNVSGRIYFGELTFFHSSGMAVFEPKEWNLKLGEMIKLPQKTL